MTTNNNCCKHQKLQINTDLISIEDQEDGTTTRRTKSRLVDWTEIEDQMSSVVDAVNDNYDQYV